MSTAEVRRPGSGVKAVGAVVGHGNGLVVVVERQDRHDGPENLLLIQPHAAIHIGQNGGMHKVAAPIKPMPARDDLYAVALALIDEAHDTGELLLADERANYAAFFPGTAQ